MTLALVIVVALVWALVRWRRARRYTEAGLTSSRPVFMVDPPTRRLGSRKREAL